MYVYILAPARKMMRLLAASAPAPARNTMHGPPWQNQELNIVKRETVFLDYINRFGVTHCPEIIGCAARVKLQKKDGSWLKSSAHAHAMNGAQNLGAKRYFWWVHFLHYGADHDSNCFRGGGAEGGGGFAEYWGDWRSLFFFFKGAPHIWVSKGRHEGYLLFHLVAAVFSI
jgi:hypothetical protein